MADKRLVLRFSEEMYATKDRLSGKFYAPTCLI